MSAPSILMCVGREYYKLHEYISEAKVYGVSKHISITAVPENLIQGESKVFLAHPDAIVSITAEDKTIQSLAFDLAQLGVLEELDLFEAITFWHTAEALQPGDDVPAWMLPITIALSKLETKDHTALVKEYGLEFYMGVFGYAFFSGLQYVTKPGETSLPESLEHLEGYVEPVHVEHAPEELPE